jgi:Ca2+-transporting ATPase
MNKDHNWYKQKIESIYKTLGSSEDGLSDAEVVAAQKKHGSNELVSAKPVSPLQIFINQFKDVLIIILLIAATISLGLSIFEHGSAGTESLLIYGIVFAIAAVGFFNEYRAEKTVASLKTMLAFTARVRRGGHVVEIDAKELVPGDIILLEEGQKIPADARLTLSSELKVNESSLTGESQPVTKKIDTLTKTLTIGDQRNMIFSGTFVTSGAGEAVVTGIGSNTEIGKIAQLVEGVEQESTPMQRKLDALGKKLGFVVLGLCVLVFIVVLLFDQEISGSMVSRLIFAFTAAVALAVAAIPEGLAFVVRISLALGARRMAKQNALVRKLSAVEALGSTDVICSDKTGTLTKGEMTVRSVWADGQVMQLTEESLSTEQGLSDKNGKPITASEATRLLMTIGALNNNAHLRDQKIIGDPTEAALLVSAQKIGMNYRDSQAKYKRVKEFAFSSDRKMMSTVHADESTHLVAVKGAPDVVLAHASYVLIDGKKVALTEVRRQEILKQNSAFANQALRVLGFAMKESKLVPKNAELAESDLIFVGLQAMIDPPRPEVAEVIQRVQNDAGMRVIMITGDHVDTARAIAKELNIQGDAISGVELDSLTPEEFAAKADQIGIYARVSPEHKIRIVQALKKKGHQVAMTGDGVNDAPAIKAADIGIAMGITGTDVTKEAADLILLDDQFLTIIAAIEEGRGIFDNVRKFVNFLLSANIAEVITILAGIIFARKLLLSPSQILFINIVTDGLPAIALGSDPVAKGIMKFAPKKYQAAIINTRTWIEIVVFGFIMTAALLLLYNSVPAVYSGAIVFTGMVVFEMARLIDIRTDYKIKWFANPLLSVAIAASLLLQVAVIHIPAFAALFDVNALLASHWFYILILSVVLVGIMKVLNKPFDKIGHEHH